MNDIVKKDDTALVAITPMEMISQAIAKGADVDTIEKLMALSERYEDRKAHKSFIVAMSKFQKDAPPIEKLGKVAFESKKGGADTNYNYSKLPYIIQKIKPLMIECELTHSWKTSKVEGKTRVTCIITHIDGHSEESWLESEIDATGNKNNLQGMGSAVSYLERYTLLAALGLVTEEMDDDAQALSEISPAQCEELNKRLDDCGAGKKDFCERMGVESINKIQLKHYGKADNLIKSREKRLAKK